MASLLQAEAAEEGGSSHTHLYKDSVSTELLVHGRVSPIRIPGLEELWGPYVLQDKDLQREFHKPRAYFFSLDSAF